ncbi:MAG: hypothetical protein J7M38_00635, partial [Armatimonadetes bacterium]|nr:hypothetical protein [Armatimonadota bacterium]
FSTTAPMVYVVRVKGANVGPESHAEFKLFAIFQSASQVSPGVNTDVNPLTRVQIYGRQSGVFVVSYVGSDGVAHFWNGNAWTTTMTTLPGFVQGSYYVVYFYNDGSKWWLRITDDAGNVKIDTSSAPVPWSDVKDDGNPYWFWVGEIYTNYYYADIWIDYIIARKYIEPEPLVELQPSLKAVRDLDLM